MSIPYVPFVGDWYRTVDARLFEVVAVDNEEDTIDIQYFDGDVSELDIEEWNQLQIESVDAPEDWSGPFDNVVADDFGDTDSAIHPDSWDGPLGDFERSDY